VVGQIVPISLAPSVRGHKLSVRRGKNLVPDLGEARKLLDGMDLTTPVGVPGGVLTGLMTSSSARIIAALGTRVEELCGDRHGPRVHLREKGGKRDEMPRRHNLKNHLMEHIEETRIAVDPKGPLFRTILRKTKQLIRPRLRRANACAMIQGRAAEAALIAKISNPSFRATRIAVHLKSGGGTPDRPPPWPITPALAPHISTTAASIGVTLNEIERVVFLL
jgi:hypothetical protein